MSVFAAINAVQTDLAKIGISKDSVNQQQRFKFRGIDAVYTALAPLLAKHKLVIIPRIRSRTETVRQTKSGGVLYSVTVDIDYTFADSEGNTFTAGVIAEAMDSGDKATNKAMSAAYKYLCLQTFCIPTEGESPDADAVTHEETHESPSKKFQAPTHIDVDKLYGQLENSAHQSMAMLEEHWKGLTADERKSVGMDNLKCLKEGAA